MKTVIFFKNGMTFRIPHSDWKFTNDDNISVVDEIDHDRILASFNYENIAGVYGDNDVRLRKYD